MARTVAQMSRKEFEKVLGSVIERKLAELLIDPDRGWEIRAPVRSRLARQKAATRAGLRGEPLSTVKRRMGLE
jgi:hypothetical protein